GPVKRNSRKIVQVGAGTIGSFSATPSSGSGTISGYRREGTSPTPASGIAPPAPPRDSEAPIPLKRTRARKTPTPGVPKDALYTLAELRASEDRDTIGRIAAKGMLAVAQRAAFFVVKRGVVQGWEGATVETVSAPGFSREALRNLWIPVTSTGAF